MRKETSAGAIIFFQNKNIREYLLLYYLGGHWDFPKGHVELGENPIETVIREVKEETNLNIKIIKNFQRSVIYNFRDHGELVIKEVIFFLAKSKSQKVKLSNEHKGYVWLTYKKAIELITYNKKLLIEAENFLKTKRN